MHQRLGVLRAACMHREVVALATLVNPTAHIFLCVSLATLALELFIIVLLISFVIPLQRLLVVENLNTVPTCQSQNLGSSFEPVGPAWDKIYLLQASISVGSTET